MGDRPQKSLFVAVLVAGVVALIVSIVRLVGELQGWPAVVFSTEPGGGLSPLGVTWLALPFGFWFGVRLSGGGHPPRSIGLALGLPIVGLVLGISGVALSRMMMEPSTPDQWEQWFLVGNLVMAGAGLLTLIAWPRAWLALALFGVLSRAPVAVIQYFAIVKGWDVHYAKLTPEVPEEVALFALTSLQCLGWPFGWTTLAGGIAAAIGAAMAGGKKKTG